MYTNEYEIAAQLKTLERSRRQERADLDSMKSLDGSANRAARRRWMLRIVNNLTALVRTGSTVKEPKLAAER